MMLQLLGVIFVMYIYFKVRTLWQDQQGFKLRNENPLFIYVLGGLLNSLTSDDRILIRDNIDGVFKHYRRHYKSKEIDIRQIGNIHKTFITDELSAAETHVLDKMFKLLEKNMIDAPSCYRDTINVNELHRFLKEKI